MAERNGMISVILKARCFALICRINLIIILLRKLQVHMLRKWLANAILKL